MMDFNSERMMASYLAAGGVFAVSAMAPGPTPQISNGEGSTALTIPQKNMAYTALAGGVGATAGGMVSGAAFSAGTAGAGLAGGLVGSLVESKVIPAETNKWAKAGAAGVSAGVVTYLVAGLI